jgi:ATP-dependent 26S proteasome regulatory subunit
MPGPDERFKLWKNGFSSSVVLEESIDLKEIAREYEISGGIIINVIQHCSLKALSRNSNRILLKDLIEGIRKEFNKNRRTI